VAFSASDPLVLLVDDDDESRENTVEYLEFVGFRVVAAGTAAAALDAAAAEAPAVAILDLVLPDADGEELARMLRARPPTKDTALVVLSGRRLDDVHGQHPGLFTEVLRKPVDPARLEAVLRRCLGERGDAR
jgi:CheY-like chemotaxis protein